MQHHAPQNFHKMSASTKERLSQVEARLPGFGAQLRELFEHLDAASDARVSRREFLLHLASRGLYLSHADQKRLLSQADLSRQDFEAWALDKEARLHSVFETIDVDGRGISRSELLQACHLAHLTQKDADRIFKTFDADRNESISYQEFYEALKHGHWFLDGAVEPVLNQLNIQARSMELDQDEAGLLVEFRESGGNFRHLLAALTASCFTRTAVAPLDRIACLLQVPTYLQKGVVCPESGAVRFHSSIRQAVSAAVGQHGVMGLWRGNLVNLSRLVPEITLRAFLFENFKDLYARFSPDAPSKTHLAPHQRLICATSASVLAYSAGYPLSLIKTQMQAAESKTFSQLVRGTFSRQHSIFTFYRGMCPSLLRIALDTAFYETGKAAFSLNIYPRFADHSLGVPSLGALLMVGTAATTTSQLITYPFLLARTRMQVSALEVQRNVIAHSPWFKSFPGLVATFRHIYRNEGFRGLYRGALVSSFKVVPTATVTVLGYDAMKRQLGVKTVF